MFDLNFIVGCIMSKLTLTEWANDHFRTPPSSNTLRKWAREGRITPLPIKHGRNYYVEFNAHYREPERLDRTTGSSLVERVEAARRGQGV
jgi:predicted site-specific integrase-resolvase